MRGVAAVGFSASGRLLASVGLDDAHTVHVWDWRSSPPKLIHTVPGGRDEVWGLKWCPRGGAVQRAQLGEAAAAAAAARGAFVTFGRNHVKLWSSGGGGWESKLLRFEAAPVSDVLCVEFLPGGALATGSPGGALLLWRGKRCVCAVRAHAVGSLAQSTIPPVAHHLALFAAWRRPARMLTRCQTGPQRLHRSRTLCRTVSRSLAFMLRGAVAKPN